MCTQAHTYIHTHSHTHSHPRSTACLHSSTFLPPRRALKCVWGLPDFNGIHIYASGDSVWLRGRNELSFSVAVERKTDPRASFTLGSSFVGNSPNPLFQPPNRVMVLLAEGHGEERCMGEQLSVHRRKCNSKSCKTTAIQSTPTALAPHISVTSLYNKFSFWDKTFQVQSLLPGGQLFMGNLC